MRSPKGSPPSSWNLVPLIGLLAYALISDWQLGLLILVMLPSVAWAMERLGGSMRRAATRGMRETGDLAIALTEAMDGRRIVKAYGLEGHSIARVDSRLKQRLRTLLKAVRLRAAAAPVSDIFLGATVALVSVCRRLAEPARSAYLQHLHGLHRGAAADSAAGTQSLPAMAHRVRRCRRRPAHLRCHRRAAPPSSTGPALRQ